MGAFLLALAVKLLGPALVDRIGKLPWRLILIALGTLAIVIGGNIARARHAAAVADIKATADAAGYARAHAEIAAAQAAADAAAIASQRHVAAAGASLNKETVDDFTQTRAGIDGRVAALRLQRQAAGAAHSRGANAVPGAAGAAAGTDGAAIACGLPDAGISLDTELKIRADAELIGAQLDALQAWERERVKIEQDAAAARAEGTPQ